jgi:hypothetical protein
MRGTFNSILEQFQFEDVVKMSKRSEFLANMTSVPPMIKKAFVCTPP